MMDISIKRQKRYERHLTAKEKHTKYGPGIHQEQYVDSIGNDGKPVYRVKYLHVTKGWRDRRA